jgi:hypothetical protein
MIRKRQRQQAPQRIRVEEQSSSEQSEDSDEESGAKSPYNGIEASEED